MIHDFKASIEFSNAAADRPEWEQLYRSAFPRFLQMADLRKDGAHQREGIDRSIILDNGEREFVDEKVRGYRFNDASLGVWDDIFLETVSDVARKSPGWVTKTLRANWIAYLVAPIGTCYLLPVHQLQAAWKLHGDDWTRRYGVKKVRNKSWVTLGVPVETRVLFSAIGQRLRLFCDPFDPAAGTSVKPRSSGEILGISPVVQSPPKQTSLFDLLVAK